MVGRFCRGLAFLSLTAVTVSAAPDPILLGPPVEFAPAPEIDGRDVRYIGQSAVDGMIDLTANNGFFNHCFRADGPGPLLPNDEDFTYISFDHLKASRDVPGTARWHLYVPEPGDVTARLHLTVPQEDAGYEWIVRLGDHVQTLTSVESDSESPQPETLSFKVETPGLVSLVVDCTDKRPAPKTKIHFIRLEGSAIESAKLLRTFRRPQAKHVGFKPPPDCVRPNAWVFESEQITDTGFSYSPISTTFGYFGTVFNHEGKIAPGSQFNFSMWVGREDDLAPPSDQLPRLIATAIPGADFSFFGTEGAGVKLRGAVAYPQGADRTIQAMRVEYADRLWTFYGYYYDESSQRWVLYAAGQKPEKAGRPDPDLRKGTIWRNGSFVEVPGPAHHERSGDAVRVVRRRGWYLDENRVPYRVEMEPHRALAKCDPNKAYTPDEFKALIPSLNVYGPQRSYYMEDYAASGWVATTVGGMVRYNDLLGAWKNLEKPEGEAEALPPYLQPDKLRQLEELPFDIGDPKVLEMASDRVVVEYPVAGTPTGRTARLYYGTQDSLTYPRREIGGAHANRLTRDLFGPRAWQHEAEPSQSDDGLYRFEIDALELGATYYYRILVAGDAGTSWDFETHSFTLPVGEALQE